MNNYYKDQLSKIEANNTGSPALVKITKMTDGKQKQTNWLSLNDESATELFLWLKEHFNIKDEEGLYL